jgi:hypothetical protein
MTDHRQFVRCTNCGRIAAVAPDREEPAGGEECWSCAFNATDLATMKSEASDAQVQSRMEDDVQCLDCGAVGPHTCEGVPGGFDEEPA